MQLPIGPFDYSVRRKWSLAVDGEHLDGYCASSIRCIFLDGDLDDKRLVATLRHEHEHCWEFELGSPATAEDRANFHATVSTSFDKHFAAQGGLESLLKIPIEGLPPLKSRIKQRGEPTIADRVFCGVCNTPVMNGSVFTGESRPLESLGISVLERGFQCPVCGVVQTWVERANREGLPSGEYISAKLLSGGDAAKWIDEHREVFAPYNACD